MEIVAAALLTGLLATPHCAAMCGSFASVCSRTRAGSIAWHAGRGTMYALLGAVAGGAGAIAPGPPWLPAAVSAVLFLWFALSLAGVAPQRTYSLPGLRYAARLLRAPQPIARFGFGMLNGLLPCAMVYAALALAIASASPLHGAAAMLVFGAATVPGLAFLSLTMQRFARRGMWQRRAIAVLVLVVGAWSIMHRVSAARDENAHHHVSAPTTSGLEAAPTAASSLRRSSPLSQSE
jgi:sulfite exporter TauE/SafE